MFFSIFNTHYKTENPWLHLHGIDWQSNEIDVDFCDLVHASDDTDSLKYIIYTFTSCEFHESFPDQVK